ncbi:unnamed protein product [Moneuplotes crassus]|uniref:Uncharacterized protein n=1 Tax=Euplotes crassus TaxID=5936 RepID=A0AAD2D2G4_EUPCR|nr:unnamed protein product [Moneuplotes crassus]
MENLGKSKYENSCESRLVAQEKVLDADTFGGIDQYVITVNGYKDNVRVLRSADRKVLFQIKQFCKPKYFLKIPQECPSEVYIRRDRSDTGLDISRFLKAIENAEVNSFEFFNAISSPLLYIRLYMRSIIKIMCNSISFFRLSRFRINKRQLNMLLVSLNKVTHFELKKCSIEMDQKKLHFTPKSKKINLVFDNQRDESTGNDSFKGSFIENFFCKISETEFGKCVAQILFSIDFDIDQLKGNCNGTFESKFSHKIENELELMRESFGLDHIQLKLLGPNHGDVILVKPRLPN